METAKREELVNDYKILLKSLGVLKSELHIKEFELREIERKLDLYAPREMRY